MQKLVSIVIPAYNRENIIRECLESVLNQTYKNIEIIVVDDCSDDNTVNVVNSIGDERIRCCKLQQNSGACFARNYGAALARGEYIAFQDSDDIWLPEKLEKQVKYLEKGNFDMVFCGMQRIMEGKTEKFFYPPMDFDESGSAPEQILFENRISTQCILMCKYVFEKVKFDPEIKRFQDWDYAINAAHYFNIGYLKEALVISEIQANSISKNANRFNALKVIYEKYQDEIDNNNKLYTRFMCKFAEEIRHTDLKKASEYYRKSLKRNFQLKNAVKYVLSVLRLRNYFGN